MKTKSSVPATTKALQAWQSELRRLEKRLEEWHNELTAREKTLEQQEAAFADALDNADGETVQLYADKFSPSDEPCDEDCGCTPEDAASNCDCPKCSSTRTDWADTKHPQTNGFGFPDDEPILSVRQPAGDEVTWLESLWKLEDRRKKKK
jgi:hypothetical protein